MYPTTQSEYVNKNDVVFTGFLSTVRKVFTDEESMSIFNLDVENDSIKIYNNNENFSKIDTKFLGAIELNFETTFNVPARAFPLDKNIVTYPIVGETVLVLQIDNNYFWLPYSKTLYPNYRENYLISEVTKERKEKTSNQNKKGYSEFNQSKIPNSKPIEQASKQSEYEVKEKIKYLRPKTGDTIITGRVGNTIRFSELFLTEDEKTSSPSIFIRNKQNPELDDKKIGELVEEDINKDGTSIYIVSNKVKVPFDFKNVSKQTVAFKDFPSTKSLTGDQLYVNSDRVVLSAKAKEFIIYGKGNSGVITDGRFSIDAKAGVYVHSENDDVTLHTINGKNIFLNSDSSGKIYLGKNKGEGGAGADVQKMVLGGELVSILEEILDAINQQVYLTPSGPTATGPTNSAKFNSIKNKLNTILSGRNFLSKQ
jgi:hypothetical protein